MNEMYFVRCPSKSSNPLDGEAEVRKKIRSIGATKILWVGVVWEWGACRKVYQAYQQFYVRCNKNRLCLFLLAGFEVYKVDNAQKIYKHPIPCEG